jgi:hypothetical protein
VPNLEKKKRELTHPLANKYINLDYNAFYEIRPRQQKQQNNASSDTDCVGSDFFLTAITKTLFFS